MTLTIHARSTTEGAEDYLIATITLDEQGKAVCEPPDALDGFLRDGQLDLADRSIAMEDGEEFIRALSSYPLGGYLYSTF